MQTATDAVRWPRCCLSNPFSKRKSNNVPPLPKFPSNVIPLPSQGRRATDFDRLTVELVRKQFREGKLPDGVLVAFLVAIGLHP